MSERRRREKEEKEEKGREEKEEKEEKSREEKRRGDRVSAVVWAAILIWAGLVLLQETTHVFEFTWWNTWAVFFVGAGVIMLLGVIYRLLVPEYRRPVMGSIIFAFILLGVGLGGLVTWEVIWPAVLIAIALVILIRVFTRRREQD